jgi:DNA polymerase-3 subunit alpha
MDDKSSVPTLSLKQYPQALPKDMLNWEKELLGLYVSGHPLDPHREKFEKSGVTIAKLREENAAKPVAIGAIVDEVREIITKKNDRMAFVKVSDFTGTLEVVFFPRTYAGAKDLIIAGKCIAIRGQLSKRNDEMSLIAEAVKELV